MPPSTATKRPRAEATRQRILDTATKLFLSEGYSNTSLEHVAQEAKVTKPTVYSHFKSKHGLFDAVIQRHAESRIAEVSKLFAPTDDPRADLIALGDLLLERILSKQTQRWDRLAAAESIDHPEVGETFYQAGPAQVVKGLSNYLRKQHQAKRLDVAHPQRAAEQLIGLFLGLDLLRAQIGQPALSLAQRRRKSREAVDVFLAAYQR